MVRASEEVQEVEVEETLVGDGEEVEVVGGEAPEEALKLSLSRTGIRACSSPKAKSICS